MNYVHAFAGREKDRSSAAEQDGHVSKHDMHRDTDFTSWESRYVGNVRAINAGLLDSYLLKSLDGIGLEPSAGGVVIRPCGLRKPNARNLSTTPLPPSARKLCVFMKGPEANVAGFHTPQETIYLGCYSPSDPWSAKVVKALGPARVHLDRAKIDPQYSGMFLYRYLATVKGRVFCMSTFIDIFILFLFLRIKFPSPLDLLLVRAIL